VSARRAATATTGRVAGTVTERTLADMTAERDLIVIGAGIAGLTAAVTAARPGLRTLVVCGPVIGGHLLSIAQIDGYPGHPEGIPGFELCPAAEEQASEAGAEFLAEEASAIEHTADGWQVTCEGSVHTARAVILATGTTLRELGVDGEKRLTGKGVSHCASCDAPLLRGKAVAVIGGGDSALQEALTLVPVASRVTIVTDAPSLTAQAAYRDRIAQAAHAEVRTSTRVLAITGDDAVRGLQVTGPGGKQTLDVAAAFVFVGLVPSSGLVRDLDIVDPAGFIRVDPAMRTAIKGLYAAGTVRAGAAFRAAASAGDGATAALSAFADISSGTLA
jgi:thioredoxin reductase (NADPH)